MYAYIYDIYLCVCVCNIPVTLWSVILSLIFPHVYCFLRECITVEGPKPDGVPDRKRYGHMKLLQFHANYRPAYWGTWSKKSSHVSPRCPFRQDKVRLFSKGINLFSLLVACLAF